MKLTKTRVESLPPPHAGQALFWDEELKGFGVRVTASGHRTYIAQGRINGKTRRVSIGPHGRWTCEEARREAREQLRNLDLGVDPRAERQRSQALGITLRQVVAEYLEVRELKANSQADLRKHLRTSFSAWADRPVASITREDCISQFRSLSQKGPSQANQAFVNLRALLNYAGARHRLPDGRSILPENPVAVLSQAKLWNRETPRSTRIPTDKVGRVWSALDACWASARLEIERTSIDYVRFLLTTGARATEAGSLTWAQVQLDDHTPTWHLPDPKNGRPVTFPLSSLPADLLRHRKQESRSEFVFPSPGAKGHIADARGVLTSVSSAAGLAVTRHDLRRTFTALAIHCGLELWKAELLTGHVPQTVTLRHYMETSDLRYLHADVERIGTWIFQQGLIARAAERGENVVALRA